MSRKKLSRNAPCPCGSGKKYKHCCWNKDIDWEARKAAAPRPLLPRAVPRPKAGPPPDFAMLGPFRRVDARLKEIANSAAGPAAWKGLVESLTDATSADERMRAYHAVTAAGVLPADAADFLFGHATQWLPVEDTDDDAEDALDRHTLALLRRHGVDDLADLFAGDRLEYDRRYERGRQFFHGPPDDELAQRLREKGVID